MNSPYPTSEITKYKDFQRAKNKADAIWLKLENERDLTKKMMLWEEFLDALEEWNREAKKIDEQNTTNQ